MYTLLQLETLRLTETEEIFLDADTIYGSQKRINVCLEVKTTDSDESRFNKKHDINLHKKKV